MEFEKLLLGNISNESNEMILETKKISKRFGSLTALTNVDLSVEEGEIFGIAGPNGAGKSTLFNVIAGHYPASE